MKYYLIVGEASGDLHASHLMQSLKAQDPEADFRFFGGDLMTAVGGTRVKHFRELAPIWVSFLSCFICLLFSRTWTSARRTSSPGSPTWLFW